MFFIVVPVICAIVAIAIAGFLLFRPRPRKPTFQTPEELPPARFSRREEMRRSVDLRPMHRTPNPRADRPVSRAPQATTRREDDEPMIILKSPFESSQPFSLMDSPPPEHGGHFGGAGSSGSWDPPADTSSSCSSDSSSSFDSSSCPAPDSSSSS